MGVRLPSAAVAASDRIPDLGALMRDSRVLQPVRRFWVLIWLLIVLALSLWAVWSAQHADADADTAATRHCVQ